MSKIVVTWPESQILFDCEDYQKHCKLINGDKGLDCYGSSAYVVDKDWWDKRTDSINDNEEYDEENEVECCYDEELMDLGFLDEDEWDD